MDCQMPVMDGPSATRAIRAWEAARGLRRTPILAVAAHASDADRATALGAGMDLYLQKPARRDHLARTLLELTRASSALSVEAAAPRAPS